MAVTYAFAGLPVADYAAAYDWYLRLFGRPADMFPHEREAVWRMTPNSSIYLVEDAERAGSGLVTLALDDLDAHERWLGERGVAYAERTSGDAPRRLVVEDMDGNTVAFFQDPAASEPEPRLSQGPRMTLAGYASVSWRNSEALSEQIHSSATRPSARR